MSSEDSQNLAGLIALISDLQKTIQILTAKLDKYEKKNGESEEPRVSSVPVVPMPGSSSMPNLSSALSSGLPTPNLNPSMSAYQWRNYDQNSRSQAGRVLPTDPYPTQGTKSKDTNKMNKKRGLAQNRGPYDPAKDRNNVAFYKISNESNHQGNILEKTNASTHTKKRHSSDNIGGDKKKTIESDDGESEGSVDSDGRWTIATGKKKRSSPMNRNPIIQAFY